jgi:hypothetical protein
MVDVGMPSCFTLTWRETVQGSYIDRRTLRMEVVAITSKVGK